MYHLTGSNIPHSSVQKHIGKKEGANKQLQKNGKDKPVNNPKTISAKPDLTLILVWIILFTLGFCILILILQAVIRWWPFILLAGLAGAGWYYNTYRPEKRQEEIAQKQQQQALINRIPVMMFDIFRNNGSYFGVKIPRCVRDILPTHRPAIEQYNGHITFVFSILRQSELPLFPEDYIALWQTLLDDIVAKTGYPRRLYVSRAGKDPYNPYYFTVEITFQPPVQTQPPAISQSDGLKDEDF